ncbi:hypothetical protein B5P46_21680 [Rhizobium leguminosarum]|uniref:Uncharacterized protein n=1 Tax=Rhizobium leguminosarum TaxID=384 RepID=A0A4Q1TV40_RHILE|nr:hypothetical protein B5P46_21680 [Rhizobium leguminosarum]
MTTFSELLANDPEFASRLAECLALIRSLPESMMSDLLGLKREPTSSPNEDSIVRLIGAMLFEANDEWQRQQRYMQGEAMADLNPPAIEVGEATSDYTESRLIMTARVPHPKLHQLDGRYALMHPPISPDRDPEKRRQTKVLCHQGSLLRRGSANWANP